MKTLKALAFICHGWAAIGAKNANCSPGVIYFLLGHKQQRENKFVPKRSKLWRQTDLAEHQKCPKTLHPSLKQFFQVNFMYPHTPLYVCHHSEKMNTIVRNASPRPCPLEWPVQLGYVSVLFTTLESRISRGPIISPRRKENVRQGMRESELHIKLASLRRPLLLHFRSAN